MVVLPTPGGPHITKENRCLFSIVIRRGLLLTTIYFSFGQLSTRLRPSMKYPKLPEESPARDYSWSLLLTQIIHLIILKFIIQRFVGTRDISHDQPAINSESQIFGCL